MREKGYSKSIQGLGGMWHSMAETGPSLGLPARSTGLLGMWKVFSLLTLFCAVAAIASPAQTYNVVFSFDGTNGSAPNMVALVQGTDGNFYGTTLIGGANSSCSGGAGGEGCGTVFKITPTGHLTTLHSFAGYPSDGANPYAGVILGTDGNFYGTTEYGGSSDGGTIFKITPKGVLTTLHSFTGGTGQYAEGLEPLDALVQGTNGKFYGTTQVGGEYGLGTIFEIDGAGNFTTLHSFDVTDGNNPFAGLIQANNGNFYGTTVGGGGFGDGNVFEMDSSGAVTTLYSFCVLEGCIDGEWPWAGLVQGVDGNFYGTTFQGGDTSGCDAPDGCGTTFQLTPKGMLTTLYTFTGNPGAWPNGGLIQATDGYFYGTTEEGGPQGPYGPGMIYRISAAGAFTKLYSFCAQTNCADGEYPATTLLQATNGTFYGVTCCGGAGSNGVVFSLSMGLGPFVETLPTSGKVGATVKILGNKLRGTTDVTFNGTEATFSVVSPNEIKTTVPSGATTGPVQVTTPKGTLTSNVVFRVKQ